MFFGLTSRWTIPSRWHTVSADANSCVVHTAFQTTSSGVRPSPFFHCRHHFSNESPRSPMYQGGWLSSDHSKIRTTDLCSTRPLRISISRLNLSREVVVTGSFSTRKTPSRPSVWRTNVTLACPPLRSLPLTDQSLGSSSMKSTAESMIMSCQVLELTFSSASRVRAARLLAGTVRRSSRIRLVPV